VLGFRGTIAPVGAEQRARMKGVSWHVGCPVALRDLRELTLTHWGFDGRVRVGTLIVRRDVAEDVLSVMRTLYAARFPFRRIVPIDAYGASDYRSIEADNTSGFNCRYVSGTTRWSEHAYGRAVDVNPLENPYVSQNGTRHPRSRPYLDRARRATGMIHAGDVVVRSFAAIGWSWGGYWHTAKDYQHFSATGR
jgi:hypothetical protein